MVKSYCSLAREWYWFKLEKMWQVKQLRGKGIRRKSWSMREWIIQYQEEYEVEWREMIFQTVWEEACELTERKKTDS